MTTDLEQRLSESLHREAAQIVPDGPVPPLPEPSRRWRPRSAPRTRPAWRAPAVAAAAVLLIAVTTATIAQHQQRGTADSASGTGGAAVSRVLNRPAPAFNCDGAPTTHAARIGAGFVAGISGSVRCTISSGGRVMVSDIASRGALRDLASADGVTVGIVDSSVSGVRWIPQGGDESSVLTVDLYRLGALRAFTVPSARSGTVVLFSGSRMIARKDLPAPPPLATGRKAAALTADPDSPPSAEQEKEAALDALADQARTIGASDDDFVDAGIDNPTNSVIVWRYGPGALTDDVVAQYQAIAPSGVHVQIRRALLTDQQMDHLYELVRSKLPALKAAGVTVNAYGGGNGRDKPFFIDYSGNPPSADMIQQFQVYGDGTVAFHKGGVNGLVGMHTVPVPSSQRTPPG